MISISGRIDVMISHIIGASEMNTVRDGDHVDSDLAGEPCPSALGVGQERDKSDSQSPWAVSFRPSGGSARTRPRCAPRRTAGSRTAR